MKLSYRPSHDEIILEIRPLLRRPTIVQGSLKIWGDERNLISGIAIRDLPKILEEFCALGGKSSMGWWFGPYLQKILEEFRAHKRIIKLGGLWKDVSISNADIQRARQALLAKLEE